MIDGLIPGIVDAHVQQWDRRQTPWTSSRISRIHRYVPSRMGQRAFALAVPQSEREYVLTPRTMASSYEPRHYLADTAAVRSALGVPIESVVVSNSYWRPPDPELDPGDAATAEVRFAAGLPFGVKATPALGAMMVRGDPRADGFADRLDAQLAVSDAIRGIQTTATRHPDPKVRDGGPVDGMIASAAFLRGMAAVAERGLAAEVLVYSHQLYDVVTLAREYPDTTIIVDHFGCPVGAFGPVGLRTGTTAAARADILRLWRERMTSLAAQPNVVVKLSGLALPVLGYGREPEGNIGARSTLTSMIGPLVEHVVAHFGASRVMFGSNYPIDKPNASVEMIASSLCDILQPWGDVIIRNVFRETARRVYQIDDLN